MTTHQPANRLVALAATSLQRSEREAVNRARETLFNREKHVEQGRRLQVRAGAAYDDFLDLQTRLRDNISRPRWLTPRINFWAKVLLICSEIAAGTATLYVGGDPILLALPTFTGIAIATVLAGTHIGIHARRREEGAIGGLLLLLLAGSAILLSTGMFAAYRYLTQGATFAVLAFITIMVALGSTFLGYMWHDRTSDQIKLAEDAYLDIEQKADAAFNHPAVQEFEQAEAQLRPSAWEALNAEYRNFINPRTSLQDLTNPQALTLPAERVSPPTAAMVEELLVILVGIEIRRITPKTIDTERLVLTVGEAIDPGLDIDRLEQHSDHEDDEAA